MNAMRRIWRIFFLECLRSKPLRGLALVAELIWLTAASRLPVRVSRRSITRRRRRCEGNEWIMVTIKAAKVALSGRASVASRYVVVMISRDGEIRCSDCQFVLRPRGHGLGFSKAAFSAGRRAR